MPLSFRPSISISLTLNSQLILFLSNKKGKQTSASDIRPFTITWWKQKGYYLTYEEYMEGDLRGFRHFDPPEEQSRHYTLLLYDISANPWLLATYRIALPNCVFSTTPNFIKDILVPTLQNYRTNNQRSTRYDELQDPDNIDQMEVYSGTSRTTLQPVVVSTSVSNFYTFIDNAGFPKPKGKAVQINII
jgi:hypothetical protein